MAGDRETLLYDSGHAHPVIRAFCAAIALIAAAFFLNAAADSILGVSFLKGQYPHGRLLGLLGTLVLSWWCLGCAIGRNRVYFDTAANRMILRGPGLFFRQRDICYDAPSIAAVKVQHLHAGIGIRGWDIELGLTDGRRRWLTRFDESDEAGARALAQRIGEAVRKPVE